MTEQIYKQKQSDTQSKQNQETQPLKEGTLYSNDQDETMVHDQEQSTTQEYGGMVGMGTESKDQVTQSQEMHQEIGNDKQCQSANLQLGGRGRDEQRLICIPCSLTTASMHIVEWANSTILTNSDRVVLVAVRAKTAPSIGQTLPRNVVDVKQVHTIKEDEKVEEILKKFMTLIPGIQTEVEVLHGDYRTEVVKYVNAIKPNLCIVGEEHKSGFQKVFKGSTSEYLVHHLRVPVVVLPVGET